MQIAKLARNLFIVLLAALSLSACRDGGDAGLAAAASGAAGSESSAPTL